MKISPVPDIKADLEAICESVAARRPVDPDVAKRVRERAEAVRAGLKPMTVAVDLLREIRDE